MNYFLFFRQLRLLFNRSAHTHLWAVVKNIHQYRFAVSSLIFISFFLSPPLTSLANPTNSVNTALAQSAPILMRTDAETFYLTTINQLRTQHNLRPLIIDTRLSLSATQKTNDMVRQKYWGHYAPNGKSFSDYIWATSFDATRSGENLVRCIDNRQEAFAALVASPTHYAVMTGNFTNVGVVEMSDPASGCLYTTMHFSLYE